MPAQLGVSPMAWVMPRRLLPLQHGAQPPARPGVVCRKPEAGGMRPELQIHYRPPYDCSALLAFLQARTMAGIEAAGPAGYRRAEPVGRCKGW